MLETFRKIVDESLSQNVVQIMSLLTSFLSTPTNEPSYDHEIKRRALKGIQSWISFGVPIESFLFLFYFLFVFLSFLFF